MIADHLRAICFLLCDGVVPNNFGRGYTFRRVLRRAVRHGNALGLQQPFLSELIPVLSERGEEWPHIAQRLSQIVPLVRQEEELFLRTMSRGLELLAAELAQIETDVRSTTKGLDPSGALKLSAETTFQLYDTYGFPFDLTATIASERGFEVDLVGAAQLMEQQRKRARASGGVGEATKTSSGNNVVLPAEVSTAWQRNGLQVRFTGHDTLSEKNVRVLAVEMDESSAGAWVALERSPFYPTGGGQLGDIGCLAQTLGEGHCEVIATVRPYQNAIACRVVASSHGDIPWLPTVGECVDATVSADHRRGCSAHHTATHMLAAALRAVLPTENVLVQAGSEVSPRRLRYDCSGVGSSGISATALERVSELVNDAIRSGLAVRTQEMTVEDAVAKGAVADFGEKYGETVRVVTIGDCDAFSVADQSGNDRYTILEQQSRRFNNLLFAGELCGGTHVSNTSELSAFTIIKEGGVGAGTRRVEALTGEAAYEWHESRSKILGALALTLKTSVSEVPAKVAKLLEDQKSSRKQAAQGRPRKGKKTSEAESQGGQGGTAPVRVRSGERFLVLHKCGEETVNWQRDFATEAAKAEPEATHIVAGDGHIVAR